MANLIRFMLLLAIIACLPFLTFGQDRITTRQNARGELIGVFNANASMRDDFTCRVVPLVGAVTVLGFNNDDNQTQVTDFILTLDNGRRMEVLVGEEFYAQLSEAELSWIESRFFIRGSRLRLTAFQCGVGGRSEPVLHSVEIMQPRSRIRSRRGD